MITCGSSRFSCHLTPSQCPTLWFHVAAAALHLNGSIGNSVPVFYDYSKFSNLSQKLSFSPQKSAILAELSEEGLSQLHVMPLGWFQKAGAGMTWAPWEPLCPHAVSQPLLSLPCDPSNLPLWVIYLFPWLLRAPWVSMAKGQARCCQTFYKVSSVTQNLL